MAVGGAVLFLGNLTLVLAGGGSVGTWFAVVGWGALTPVYAAMPGIQRRQAARTCRSVQLNAAAAPDAATPSD